MGDEIEQKHYYNNVDAEIEKVDNAFDKGEKNCDLLRGLYKKGCKESVEFTRKTIKSGATTFKEKYKQNNEAISTIKNGSDDIGVKYGNEAPTQPTVKTTQTPTTTPATQTPEKPSRLELNKDEQQEFRRYCDHYKLKFNSNTQIYFQKHLETRKFEYLKMYDKPRNWELEFKNTATPSNT